MEIINFKENDLKDFFKIALRRKNLIPIIGAGFTKGCKACNGEVPDDPSLREIMVSKICEYQKDIISTDFDENNYKFSDIAKEYFKRVPKDIYRKFLWDSFTKVELNRYKKDLLKCSWPYLYTLNIDDGIEGNSNFEPILPYKKISVSSKAMFNCLYKMHGDVKEELKYEDIKNVVFSRDQYINSLVENESILRCFQSDYSTNNLIFIGCSLDDELDLEYAISTIKGFIDVKVERIYITTSAPRGLRLSRLEDFHITKILVIDNYDDFYNFMYEISKEINNELNDLLKPYCNTEIRIYDKQLSVNRGYLLDIIGAKSSEFSLPYFNTTTSLLSEVLTTLDTEPITIIAGKRFTGKTFLAKQLCLSIQNKNIYFFTSNITLNTNDVYCILLKKDAVFIFDSNSFDLDVLYAISKNMKKIKAGNNKLIFLINKSDGIIHGFASRLTHQNYYNIDDVPSNKDIISLNKKLTELGIINSKVNLSYLENCYNYFEMYNQPLPFNAEQISLKYFELLLIIASENKAYSIFFNLIGMSAADIDNFVKIMSPFVEITSTEEIEIHLHSGSKITSNSSSWLFRILNEFHKIQGAVLTSEYVYETVKILKPLPFGDIAAKKIISFDFLNQAFSRRGTGTIKLIESIYSKLESLLYEDAHFWLQRSKSILYLYRENIERLSIALLYAKKAYYDTKSDKQRINATTTLAMISGRIANINNYTDYESVGNAVEWYYKALQENEHNTKYIDDILEGTKRNSNDLRNLCSHLMVGNIKFEKQLKSNAEFIINRVRSNVM